MSQAGYLIACDIFMHMGTSRVHLVLSAEDRARFQAQAEREGRSLSEWLRTAARSRLEAAERPHLSSPEALDAFFDACDAGESGREPDWDEHLSVITRSQRGTAT